MIISAALIVSIFLYILIFRYYVNSTKDIILPIVIFILLNVTLNIVNNVYTKIYKYFYIYTSVDAKVPLEEIEEVARNEIKYINEQVNKLLEEIESENE